MKNIPLYLEWAPQLTFTEKSAPKSKKENKQTENFSMEIEEENDEFTTLFVKNRMFLGGKLFDFFKKCGRVWVVKFYKSSKKTLKFGS